MVAVVLFVALLLSTVLGEGGPRRKGGKEAGEGGLRRRNGRGEAEGAPHHESSGLVAPLFSDCRFWGGISQSDIRLRQKKLGKKHKVFYYWDNNKQECLPCTRCQSKGLVPLVPCQYFSDTLCGTDSDWNRSLRQKEEHDYYSQDEDIDDEDEDDVTVIYSTQGYDSHPAPDVWGREKLESEGEGTESPSVRLAKGTRQEKFGLKTQPGEDDPYGKPSFFSNTGRENAVEEQGRPFVDILRQILERNNSEPGGRQERPRGRQGGPGGRQEVEDRWNQGSRQTTQGFFSSFQDDSARDVTKTRTANIYSPKPTEHYRSQEFGTRRNSANYLQEVETQEKGGEEAVSHGKVKGQTGVNSTEVKRSFRLTESHTTDKDAVYRIEKSLAGKLRTQDSDTGEDSKAEDTEEEEGEEEKEEEGEEDEESFGIEHAERKVDDTTRSPGEEAFSEIMHLLQIERQESHLAPLQQILIASSIVAFLLLIILIAIVARNRYKNSRFKMLDAGDTTYQSMSPFHRGRESLDSNTENIPFRVKSDSVETTIPPAVARSLKNIRQQSVESKPVVVDEKGRSVVKV